MTRMIFVNLPVRDLGPSGAFYRALGGTVNGLFSDEQATCVMFSDTIGVMLLTYERYSQFTSRPIGDARTQSQALLALSVETREAVDTAIAAAVAAGGRADPNPVQDLGFMYGRSAEDPDGNVWEILWMDPAAAESGPPAG